MFLVLVGIGFALMFVAAILMQIHFGIGVGILITGGILVFCSCIVYVYIRWFGKEEYILEESAKLRMLKNGSGYLFVDDKEVVYIVRNDSVRVVRIIADGVYKADVVCEECEEPFYEQYVKKIKTKFGDVYLEGTHYIFYVPKN